MNEEQKSYLLERIKQGEEAIDYIEKAYSELWKTRVEVTAMRIALQLNLPTGEQK